MMDPQVIYEDNHLLLLNKPAGWLSQGDQTGDPSIVDWAKEYLRVKYNKPGNVFAGLPHRLDRPVSGVIIIARTSKALTRMTDKFRANEVKKKYWAVVINSPMEPEGTLENWLEKDTGRNKARVRKSGKKGAKSSVLDYRLIEAYRDAFLLEVYPHTGRPHQIRAQLAAANCPIQGDVKYRGATKNRSGEIGLHARTVTFEHPVSKEEVQFTADLQTNSSMRRLLGDEDR